MDRGAWRVIVRKVWKLLSHVRLFVTPWTIQGILQARILEWVALPSLFSEMVYLLPSSGYPDFPGGSDGQESTCHCRKPGFNPWVGKSPWRRKWQLTPVFLPEKSHRQRSVVGCRYEWATNTILSVCKAARTTVTLLEPSWLKWELSYVGPQPALKQVRVIELPEPACKCVFSCDFIQHDHVD